MSGFVYVVQNSSGLFKIGYTNDPRRRLTMLRTSTPDTLTLLGVVPGTLADEKALHSLLEPWRVTREWFRPCAAMQPLLDAMIRPDWRRRSPAVVGYPENALYAWRAHPSRRMSQAKAGALVGVTAAQWSRMESGKRTISVGMAKKLDAVTGIPKAQLRPDMWGGA